MALRWLQSGAQRLLDVVAGHRCAGVYRVALELGLRRGEILALRWADIDFERKVLAVTGTIHRHSGKLQRDAPKTESSRRLLPLTDTLAAALLEHKARQDTKRESLGDGWVEIDLVFTTGPGTAIEPHNLFDHFKAALQKAGLPDIRFHDLRHSCASILLAQNVHPLRKRSTLSRACEARTGAVSGRAGYPTGRRQNRTPRRGR
jgi:integrase